MVSTCTMPAWANRSRSTERSSALTGTVRVALRPLLTATMGLLRATRRAIRENLRGLPKVSRYSSTTSVSGSVSQYCSRSLPETSARLFTETKVDRPSLRAAASPRMAAPSGPDWQKKPTRPRPGSTEASVAFNDTAGSVLAMPSALGPTTRIPCPRTAATRSRSAANPAGPVSENPAVSTTKPLTPLAIQSSRTDWISVAGTATTARSTSSGMSRTVA